MKAGLTFDDFVSDLDKIGSLSDIGGDSYDPGGVEALGDTFVSHFGEDVCSASDQTAVHCQHM